MTPLGIDLEALASGTVTEVDPVPLCPGASLRVTRSDVSALTVHGERFQPGGDTIPYDGYGTARVACTSPVAEVDASKVGAGPRQFYGRCRPCAGLEADNRATLRARQAAKT